MANETKQQEIKYLLSLYIETLYYVLQLQIDIFHFELNN